MKKGNRTYLMYLEDIQTAMNRIAEYIVSHEYFGIDYEIIWDVAFNYLPENKIQIDQIIEKEIKNTGA